MLLSHAIFLNADKNPVSFVQAINQIIVQKLEILKEKD